MERVNPLPSLTIISYWSNQSILCLLLTMELLGFSCLHQISLITHVPHSLEPYYKTDTE